MNVPAFEDPRSPLPFLTQHIPGLGGQLKAVPEDFIVEELPLYPPCGEGEHLYLWIRKQDVSADALTAHLARTLGVSPGNIGVAGLKDRRAVTTQMISVPAHCEPRLPDVATDRIRVLEAKRHHNKLRTGHLAGNRFDILLRDVPPARLPDAQAIATHLRSLGVPNYYGEQRFGTDGDTLRLGLDLLRGHRKPGSVPPRKRRFLLRLATSAAQSMLFNEVLADRLNDGLLHTVLVGDVMQKVASGGCFPVLDPDAEQKRYNSGETVLTGPMFGPRMISPQATAFERETAVLARHELSIDHFAQWRKFAPGARRPLLVHISELDIFPEPEGLRFRFVLPPGTYATTLLREFIKEPQSAAATSE